MTEDQTLATNPASNRAAGGPTPGMAAFQKPTEPSGPQILDFDELLSAARRVETVARIYLRGDLVADHAQIITELAGLIDANGEIIEDPEASVGDVSKAARAQELADRARLVKVGMDASARWVRFRGMPSDEFAAFRKAHFPKGESPDVTAFNTRLIAETAVEPTLTIAQVEQMRKTLGTAQMTELANKAWEACATGGVDVPKSPRSLLNLAQQ